MRPLACVALWLFMGATAAALPPAAFTAALADLARVPADRQPFARYLWLADPPDKLDAAGAALCFLVCSTSREPNLDRQMPVRVAADLWRLDLGRLAWDVGEFNRIAGRSPYTPELANPLVLHGGWFLREITDGQRSDAYYRLLYGGKNAAGKRIEPPKTAAEFFAFWRVDQRRALADGTELARVIAGQSGVSVQGVRTMLAYQAESGQLWETRDVLELDGRRDPIENAGDDAAPIDGQEYILAIPKHSFASGVRGAAQVYWLTDGKGARVERADNELVHDGSRSLGTDTIHNPISCVVCHAAGLNSIAVNEYARLMRPADPGDALRRKDYDERLADKLERLLFPIGKLIERQNEDFAAFVLACNGFTPDENVAAVRGTIDRYRAAVTREQAARELGCVAEDLTLAIQEAVDGHVNGGLRLLAMANGGDLPRDLWEERYAAASSYLKAWKRRP